MMLKKLFLILLGLSVASISYGMYKKRKNDDINDNLNTIDSNKKPKKEKTKKEKKRSKSLEPKSKNNLLDEDDDYDFREDDVNSQEDIVSDSDNVIDNTITIDDIKFIWAIDLQESEVLNQNQSISFEQAKIREAQILDLLISNLKTEQIDLNNKDIRRRASSHLESLILRKKKIDLK